MLFFRVLQLRLRCSSKLLQCLPLLRWHNLLLQTLPRQLQLHLPLQIHPILLQHRLNLLHPLPSHLSQPDLQHQQQLIQQERQQDLQ